MLENIVSPADIEQDRTPAEFLSWCEALLRRINSTRNDRRQVLLHEGIAKPFYEEVYPLYRLLGFKSTEWAQQRFRNVLGDQPHDVVVSGAAGLKYIEISQADRNYTEALRMQHFEQHGSVSAIGTVTKTGTKRTGLTIRVENEARMHSELVAEKVSQIRDAITRKSAKAYPSGTALLVYLDDHIAFTEPDDAPEMDRLLREVEPVWRQRFHQLFVVGASGRRFWERP